MAGDGTAALHATLPATQDPGKGAVWSGRMNPRLQTTAVEGCGAPGKEAQVKTSTRLCLWG